MGDHRGPGLGALLTRIPQLVLDGIELTRQRVETGLQRLAAAQRLGHVAQHRQHLQPKTWAQRA